MELTSKDTGTILAAMTMAIAIVHTSTPLAIAPACASRSSKQQQLTKPLGFSLGFGLRSFGGVEMPFVYLPTYLPTYLPLVHSCGVFPLLGT
jgi:hypothetical protein